VPDLEHRITEALAALEHLHREVDREAEELSRLHAARLRCRWGCSRCCIDGITVFEIEAEHIRDRHAGLLEAGRANREGACAFLDDHGACRIYESRPYVCRTQGLPLRWFSDDVEAERVEYRDICALNELREEPVETLPAEACWSVGHYEGRLRDLQLSLGGDPPRRIALRDLFVQHDDDDESWTD
jgi:Fe-S-cluster containining protein